MSKENILFQYINGESSGKIVKLVKIDDTNPLGPMYYFDDGMKCLENMVGQWGDSDAYRAGKLISRIPSQNNIWKFREKEIRQNDKKGYDEDGKEYDIPDPYFIDKSGKILHNEKIIIKKDPIAPIYRRGEFRDIPNNFYVSYISEEPEINITEDIVSSDDKPLRVSMFPENDPKILKQRFYIDDISSITVNTDVEPYTFVDNMHSGFLWNKLSFNIIKDKGIYETDKSLQDIIETYIDSYVDFDITDIGIDQELPQSSSFNVSEPVRILVDSCKKKPQEIDMSLNIDLPGKSFYEMISDNYGEDKAKECIEYIIDNLDISIIKNSLKEALLQTYNLVNQE